MYKQYAVGIAQFDKSELKPEGGRLWYSVQDVSTGETVTTQRSSVAYPPEDGKKIPEAQAKLYGEAAGVNLSGAYGALEISGLPKEATVKVYDSKDALKPILHSAPAGEDKKILLESVPLKEEGGTVYYTIHAPGYSDAERLELAYGEVGRFRLIREPWQKWSICMKEDSLKKSIWILPGVRLLLHAQRRPDFWKEILQKRKRMRCEWN